MSLKAWNQRYAAGEKLGDAPAPLVERFTANLAPGRALDLACGPGRHALFLAERGWNVTAVDGSPVAIDYLRERADAKQLAIDSRVADLESGEFEIPSVAFDLVLDILYLQRDLIPAIQRGVRPGGMVIMAALRSRTPTATHAAGGELPSFFRGWRILHSLDDSVAELVALKPGA